MQKSKKLQYKIPANSSKHWTTDILSI